MTTPINTRSWTLRFVTLLTITLFPSGLEAMQEMNATWKNGLRLSTADGANSISIGGRFQMDAGFFNEVDAVEGIVGLEREQDGVEMRRARLAIAGVIGGNVEFKTQYDFGGGDADFKDAYVGLTDAGFLGHVRVGQLKEPMGLEWATSSKYITFAERSFTSAINPGRNTGLLSMHSLGTEDHGSVAIGYFKDVDGYGNGQEDHQSSLTGRVTYLPIFEDNGNHLLHLGASFSSRDASEGQVRYHSDSLSHMGADIVDSGDILSASADLLATEIAYLQGPWSVQAEMITSTLEDDSEVTAWYAQGSYFLSGENRPYKKSTASFSRVKPTNNYGKNGHGAIELAIRMQEIELEEMNPDENAEALSIGINWYLNANARVMFNIINASPDAASVYGNDVNSYVMRFAVNF
ncbi:MAG: porin [Planctomycetota bacterium]|nr:porin [Planctomycetota bacterium]